MALFCVHESGLPDSGRQTLDTRSTSVVPLKSYGYDGSNGCVAFATRAFATPIFVASATPIFVASATPYFRTFATRTAATPKFFFNFSFV